MIKYFIYLFGKKGHTAYEKTDKKASVRVLGTALGVAVVVGIAIFCLFSFNRPTTVFDLAEKTGAVTNGASGYLYGFAEPDIPTAEIAESVGVSTLSTKTVGGLQHPIGDASQVAETFFSAGGKEIIVYTQDMYDTWYYQFDSLEQYHERVKQTVTQTCEKPYADKVVYCIYNEMDNGQWFGDFKVYENRLKTYEAWKATFALVRSIDADAKIGGPGYCGYNSDYIKEFLEYCKAENCLPDTMIWHELGTNSLYMWEDHFADYDALCKELDITKMPVCITEYGLMSTNGIPGESVKWISRVEAVKCEGCVAYWRLADNLSDVVADDTNPNSNWWAYFWYNAMSGETVQSVSKDLFQSNMGKFLTRKSKELKYKGFTGLATIDEEKSKIQILAGGSNRDSKIILENLDKIESFKAADKVYVTAEYVDYKGLSGEVFAPKIKFAKYYEIRDNRITIELDDILYTQCYNITVTPYFGNMDLAEEIPVTDNPMRRYEAENAKAFGTAKIAEDVAYAASEFALVKATGDEESGVEFTVEIPKDGRYTLDLVYGNGANNIQYNEDGTQADKGERTDIELLVSVDGEETLTYLSLSSTLKDDFTNAVQYTTEFKQGKHTIRFTLPENKDLHPTVSFDFLDVTPAEETERNNAYILQQPYSAVNSGKSTENQTAFWVLPDTYGYYELQFSGVTAPRTLTVNGTKIENMSFTKTNSGTYNCVVYLRKGISSVSVDTGDAAIANFRWFAAGEHENTEVFSAEDFTLSGSAKLEIPAAKSTMTAMFSSTFNTYIDGIRSDATGTASITYTAPQAGYYQFAVTYSNNEEGGVHDYNVDLVERYITLSVNGENRGNYYFRNTYSWDTLKTKVITVYLEAGENTLSISNDGSYQFNGKTTFAPRITKVSVSPITLSESKGE